MELMDFAIIQRDRDGMADCEFSGILPETCGERDAVYARALREDDSLTVIYWQLCDTDREAGTWRTTLRLPAGGLYRLEAVLCEKGGVSCWSNRIKTVYHVGVGDVFLLAGQSNMTGYAKDNGYDPPLLGVHALHNDGRWCIAAHPLADAVNTIYGYPENACGSSPALSFGRMLYRRLGVPVGLIPTAIGGTPLSKWNPEQDGDGWVNAMKRFEKVDKIKGILWFQGCTDANGEDAPTYFERFGDALRHWREDLREHTVDEVLPVLTVQLNRWVAGNTDEHDRHWGMIRGAQRRAAMEYKGVYVVPAMDLPACDGIHDGAGANVLLGERLADTALAVLYGMTGQTAANIERVSYADATHILLHITPGHHVLPMDGLAMGMNVEDAEGMADCTTAAEQEDAILVGVSRPITLPAVFHYGWRAQPPAFLVKDVYGMPLLGCYGVPVEDNRTNA